MVGLSDNDSGLTIPAGSSFVGTTRPDVSYVTTSDVVVPSGQLTYPDLGVAGQAYISVRASTPGAIGNCQVGVIDSISSAPAEVVSVTNTVSLSNGSDTESDAQLRMRAHDYLGSFARVSPTALEFMALTHASPTSTSRVRFATIAEDLDTPGISRLVVDDGTGFAGETAPGAVTGGVIPLSGMVMLFHESPATEPIGAVEFSTPQDPDTFHAYQGLPGEKPPWISQPERGVVVLPPEFNTSLNGASVRGGRWRIGGPLSSYRVYTGLIAELQQEIEGVPDNPDEYPGWRCAGMRVRVMPPTVKLEDFDLEVLVKPGNQLDDVASDVRTAVLNYLATLAPGATMYRGRLTQYILDQVDSLTSVNVSMPDGDLTPDSMTERVGSDASKITLL